MFLNRLTVETIVLGFQHYILALGTAVMIPSFLVPLMGGSDVSHSLQLQFLLFCFFILFYIIMYDEIVWYCQISLLRRNGETFCFAFTLFFCFLFYIFCFDAPYAEMSRVGPTEKGKCWFWKWNYLMVFFSFTLHCPII